MSNPTTPKDLLADVLASLQIEKRGRASIVAEEMGIKPTFFSNLKKRGWAQQVLVAFSLLEKAGYKIVKQHE